VLSFETDQASFLAGYLAAGVTPTHTVAEFGGLDTPTVRVAMNGFLAGARAYGQDTGTHIRVLGWDGRSGAFVGNDFDRTKAYHLARGFIRDGAGVLFGVTGPAVLGAAAAAKQAGNVYLVGMFTDQFQRASKYAGLWLTSVLTNIAGPVFDAIREAEDGHFSGGLYIGTLSNHGVGIAPFHLLSHVVPATLQRKLRVLRGGLVQGWVSTNPDDYVPREKETSGGS